MLRTIGDNACELELPETMKFYAVVNVSQVKKYHGSLQRPPPIEIDGEKEYEVDVGPQEIRQGLPVSGILDRL